MTPSEVLTAAADRVRDLAADTTKPRPNGHGWSLLGEDDGWEPGWSTVVSCAGSGGEDVVAVDVTVGNARWIAALSPSVAGPLEAMFRFAALAHRMGNVGSQDENALTLAKAILGSGVDTP